MKTIGKIIQFIESVYFLIMGGAFIYYFIQLNEMVKK